MSGLVSSDLMERRRRLKTALRNRKPVFAAWTSFGHPSIAELFARSSVDFVAIDIEHSTIDLDQAMAITSFVQGQQSLCLPRVSSHSPEMIKRLMDAGADGVIVPMVSTAAEAKAIADCFKYSPMGHRSYGIARGQGYGFDFDRYTKEWNETSSLIVQIETVEGINNIDAILEIEAIDGVMIGPYDLSGSLGIPGQIDSEPVRAASQKVIEAAKRHGRASGTHLVEATAERIDAAFAAGHSFTVLSSDLFLLWKWAEKTKSLIEAQRAK